MSDWLETCTARASFTEATEAPTVDMSLLQRYQLVKCHSARNRAQNDHV